MHQTCIFISLKTFESLNLRCFFNTLACNIFIASVLGFAGQIEEIAPEMGAAFENVLRKLALGPGLYATPADLMNIRRALHFPKEFVRQRWIAMANGLHF